MENSYLRIQMLEILMLMNNPIDETRFNVRWRVYKRGSTVLWVKLWASTSAAWIWEMSTIYLESESNNLSLKHM